MNFCWRLETWFDAWFVFAQSVDSSELLSLVNVAWKVAFTRLSFRLSCQNWVLMPHEHGSLNCLSSNSRSLEMRRQIRATLKNQEKNSSFSFYVRLLTVSSVFAWHQKCNYSREGLQSLSHETINKKTRVKRNCGTVMGSCSHVPNFKPNRLAHFNKISAIPFLFALISLWTRHKLTCRMFFLTFSLHKNRVIGWIECITYYEWVSQRW